MVQCCIIIMSVVRGVPYCSHSLSMVTRFLQSWHSGFIECTYAFI